MVTPPVLEVRHLTKHFPVRGGVLRRQIGTVHAVDDVSFTIGSGETLGLVGESGCGKSTVAKTLLDLLGNFSGDVLFDGRSLADMSANARRALRRDVQLVFQDPMESLNPRHSVAEIIGEPLLVHRIGTAAERERRVRELAGRVGLDAGALGRYPHEFSGGQRQRIGIARAIALEPKLVVCDEPVSALDVSIQSQILNLMMELQREMGLALLFISHDLSVVKHISDRIAVMYLGQIVETAPAEQLYHSPRHPYTRALLAAIPQPRPGRRSHQPLPGDVPSPIVPPTGCRFHPRCEHATDRCRIEPPQLEATGESGAEVACLRWRELPSA